MDAGDYDTLLELLDITYADDGEDGRTTTYVANAAAPEIWGSVAPASWKQLRRAEMQQAQITHAVCIRWRPDLAALWLGKTPNHILRFIDRAGSTRSLSIKYAIDPMNDGWELELGCVEGGAL